MINIIFITVVCIEYKDRSFDVIVLGCRDGSRGGEREGYWAMLGLIYYGLRVYYVRLVLRGYIFDLVLEYVKLDNEDVFGVICGLLNFYVIKFIHRSDL